MELLLGSKSPRRKQLLDEMGLKYRVVSINCDEEYPEMQSDEVAAYLAVKKNRFYGKLDSNQLLLTADTIVVLDNRILHKPKDRNEALHLLSQLSDRSHFVITGVTLRTANKELTFSESTEVVFGVISEKDAVYYVDHCNPYDKAGGYGIQDWIGEKCIKKTMGSYHNVVGLPIRKLKNVLSTEFNLPVD